MKIAYTETKTVEGQWEYDELDDSYSLTLGPYWADVEFMGDDWQWEVALNGETIAGGHVSHGHHLTKTDVMLLAEVAIRAHNLRTDGQEDPRETYWAVGHARMGE